MLSDEDVRAMCRAIRFFFTKPSIRISNCEIVKWAFSAPPVDRHDSFRNVCGKERHRSILVLRNNAQTNLLQMTPLGFPFFSWSYYNERPL